MQPMHKTPWLWTRAGVPWIFGRDPNKIQNQHPSLCAPWSAYVDLPSEDIWKEQQLNMKLRKFYSDFNTVCLLCLSCCLLLV